MTCAEGRSELMAVSSLSPESSYYSSAQWLIAQVSTCDQSYVGRHLTLASSQAHYPSAMYLPVKSKGLTGH